MAGIRPKLEAMRRVVIGLFVFALLVAPAIGDKKPKGVPLMRLPTQTNEITNLAVPTPAQKCANWAWATAIEVMLKPQQVTLDQHYWVQKANAGEICVDWLPTMEKLARLIDGNYQLEDGRKVTLQSHYAEGAPTNPGDLVLAVRQQRPALLYWKSRAYVLCGVVYDEYIYPNNQRLFEIRELKLVDPLAAAKDQHVSFLMERDDVNDIGGYFTVEVITETPFPWQR